jgi:hypothetical protein
LLSAEQARHEASSAQSQLALARQQLRQATAAAAKPLAMSGWEDLIEEAAADLEGLESKVATAAQRLVDLQVRSGLVCSRLAMLGPERVCTDGRSAACTVQESRGERGGAAHIGPVMAVRALLL